MGLLEILLIAYFGVGFIYATYILLFGQDLWYKFPINMLFAAPVIAYTIYLAVTAPPKRMF